MRVWIPAALAGGLVAALTAALGLVFEHVKGLERWPDHLARARAGKVPRVREVTECAHWGVHPATADLAVTPYVARDAEGELRAALLRCGFVLLLGESAAGKSRMACETVRCLFPDHAWVRPFTRASIAVAVHAARACAPSVLWLDDLENYLGADGLSDLHVDHLLGDPKRGIVIVATLRSEEHRRFGAWEGSRLTGTDRDLWRTERSVVARATIVRVERLWSSAEIRRARALVPNRRIGLALAACDQFGIAESLICGPELINVWRNAWSRGANPRGAAIVSAVVDCRRAGLRRAVPVDWVFSAHEPYLAARGGYHLRPESFADARAWTCQTIHATSSLLVERGSPASLSCFDYLLGSDGLEPVPDHLWQALLPLVHPEEAYDIGLVAHGELRLSQARSALRAARDGGVPGANFALALVIGDSGHPRRAMEILRALPRHEQVGPFSLAQQLAHFQGVAGDHGASAASFRRLALAMEQALGPDNPDTLGARHQAAYYTGESGDPITAIHELTDLEAQRRWVLGADHHETLATRRSLAWFRGKTGQVDRAIVELQDLLAEAQPVLGIRDPHVLAIRSALAWFRGQAGDWDRACSELTDVLEDRQRVLGLDHPHTLTTRHQIVVTTAQSGNRPRALALLQDLVPDMERHLASDHPQLLDARRLGDQLR
ncbi:tetratricopeptide repeat protein [Streptomyces sp. NPDC006530]|uniref:tetratricopeptide repeat protein n=1 Tax=Streptomyces sp. NPDC006530 TaxID=3364750 RepID=UPI0036C1F4EE